MIWCLQNFELDVPFIPFYFLIFFFKELWLPLVSNLHLKNVVECPSLNCFSSPSSNRDWSHCRPGFMCPRMEKWHILWGLVLDAQKWNPDWNPHSQTFCLMFFQTNDFLLHNVMSINPKRWDPAPWVLHERAKFTDFLLLTWLWCYNFNSFLSHFHEKWWIFHHKFR